MKVRFSCLFLGILSKRIKVTGSTSQDYLVGCKIDSSYENWRGSQPSFLSSSEGYKIEIVVGLFPSISIFVVLNVMPKLLLSTKPRKVAKKESLKKMVIVITVVAFFLPPNVH